VLECQTEIFYKYLWLTIFSGHIWKGDIKMKNKQKDYFWTATVINPITDQDGKIIEYLIIAQEITTRKKIAVESKRLLAELAIHTQDLEQFAYIVSHNLRQPVAHIQGLASLIDIENPTSPTNIEILNKMKEAAMNMDTVFADVNEILETRTDVTLAKENIYVEDMLNRLVRHFNKQLIEVQGNVIIDCDDVRNVFSVRNNLETAISNLINNAIKYRNPEKKLIIHIKVEKTSQFILFHVEDNGLGIDIERFQNKIFALYQRFHLHVQGKGLGLHMAKNLIKAIGGNITLKSQENIGTTFTIQIPLIS
jgi:signal transduction histidine kinase